MTGPYTSHSSSSSSSSRSAGTSLSLSPIQSTGTTTNTNKRSFTHSALPTGTGMVYVRMVDCNTTTTVNDINYQDLIVRKFECLVCTRTQCVEGAREEKKYGAWYQVAQSRVD
jgi:hypothetical protein